MKCVTLSLFGLLLGPLAHAQIPAAGIYTQNFDSLASTGTVQLWSNNSTLSGWYGAEKFLSADTYAPLSHYTVFSPIPVGGNGSHLTSYGSGLERSFGSGNNGAHAISFGIRFVNSGNEIIRAFGIGFDGEQWARQAHTTPVPDTLFLSYKIYASSPGGNGLLNDTGWVSLPLLSFTSPNWNDPTAANLDGNAAGNRIANMYGLINDSNLLPGQELWLRWTSFNEASANHGLAIDNLAISFFATIPEPATYTLIFGAVAAIAAMSRRRGRK